MTKFDYWGRALTLIRLTSRKACQDWGGGSDTPPSYLSSGASQSSKNTFFWKLRSFPVYKTNFQNFFFPKSVKKSKNYRFSIIWAKNAKNFNFCNFWATSTIYTSKESIFHVEFKFCHEKYFCFKKIQKNRFFPFFYQKLCGPVGFNDIFFKAGEKNFKNDFFRTY